MGTRMKFRPSLKGDMLEYKNTNYQYPIRLSNVFFTCNSKLTKYDIKFINFSNMILGKIISTDDMFVEYGREYPVYLDFFFKLMKSRHYRELDKCISKMLDSEFTLHKFDNRQKDLKMFESIRYSKEENRIYIAYTEDFTKIYNRPAKYTHVSLENVFDSVKSKYSMITYPVFEAINALYQNEISMSVSEFKELAGYTGSNKEFNRQCLDIIIKEINENTRLNISIEVTKGFGDFRSNDYLYLKSYIKDKDIKTEERNKRDINDKHDFLVSHRHISKASKTIMKRYKVRRSSLVNLYDLTLDLFNLRIHEIANKIINEKKLSSHDKEFLSDLGKSVDLCFNNEIKKEMNRIGDIELDPFGHESTNRILLAFRTGRERSAIKARKLSLKEKNKALLYRRSETIPVILRNYIDSGELD